MARRRKRSASNSLMRGLFNFISLLGLIILKLTPGLLALVLLVFSFLGIRKAVYADPGLTVGYVSFSPEDALSENEKKVISRPLMGEHLFRIDLKGVAQRIERKPEILDVVVVKELPDSLTVKIEKRRAFAVIPVSGKFRYAVVSQDGVVMKLIDETDPDLILIEPMNRRFRWNEGERVLLNGYAACVSFVYAYWEHPVFKKESIEKIRLDVLGNMAIELGKGLEIRIGEYNDQKMEALLKAFSILEKHDRSTIEYIDLQFDEIIVKRKGS